MKIPFAIDGAPPVSLSTDRIFVTCRVCGEDRELYVFGGCRPCAVAGHVRKAVVAEIQADIEARKGRGE